MIYEVLRIGTPSLREISNPVNTDTIHDLEFQAFIDNLIETMRALNGAGICAPQVGKNIRVMVFEITHNPRYPEAEPIPLTVLINPSFEVLSSEVDYAYEGCLSMGELRGLVPRHTHIKYKGMDRSGNFIAREVENFHARVFLHEYDHLDGMLFIDRVEDSKTLGFRPELIAADIA